MGDAERLAEAVRDYATPWAVAEETLQTVTDAVERWASVRFTLPGLVPREPELWLAALTVLKAHEAALASALAAAGALRAEVERQGPTAAPGGPQA